MKTCPFCAEEIQDEAIKCKHCGEMLVGDAESSSPSPQRGSPTLNMLGALLFFGALFVSPTPMFAQSVTYYDNAASFDADFPGLAVEDFEEIADNVNLGITVMVNSPVDEFTNDPPIYPGDINSNLVFETSCPTYGYEYLALFCGGGNPYSNGTITLGAQCIDNDVQFYRADLFIEFPNAGVYSFGANFYRVGNVDFYNNQTSLGSYSLGGDGFVGVASSLPITRLIASGESKSAGVDNVRFSTSPNLEYDVFFDDFTYDCVAGCREELLNDISPYLIGGEATWTAPGEPLRQEVWHSSNYLVQLTSDQDPGNTSGVLNFEIPSGSTITTGSEGVTNPWIKTMSDVFNPGTYAARVKFSQGPDSDLTQAFWLGSDCVEPSSPDEYAEIDYEFYPSADRLDLVSWEWAGPSCEGPSDDDHRRYDQRFNVPSGVWLDLIIQVLPGYEVGFSIYDPVTGNLVFPEYWVSGDLADFTPEMNVGMNIRLQSWLQGTFGSQLTVSQDYPFEVDWIIHLRNSWSQTWSDINALVESFRTSGIKRFDSVNVLFAVGFESGNTSAWSNTVGEVP